MNSASAYNLDVTAAPSRRNVDTERCDGLDPTPDILHSVWGETARELGRMIKAMGVGPDRAEDLLQDVYVVSLEKRPAGLKDRVGLRRWLFRVTANRCRLEHRRRSRWRRVWMSITGAWSRSDGSSSSERAARQSEERRLVGAALEELSHDVRTIVVMRYFCGFNSADIGRILELPDSTVRSHLHRGRRRLAESLRKMGLDDE